MTFQGQLFGTPMEHALDAPASRLTDPISSEEAAKQHLMDKRMETQCLKVLDLVLRYPGKTSLELADISGMDRYIVARRLPQLEHGGMVRKGEIRQCTVGHRNAVTWWKA